MLCHTFPTPYPGVHAIGNDVGHAIVQHQFYRELGVQRQKLLQVRLYQRACCYARGVDPDHASGLITRFMNLHHRLLNGTQGRLKAVPQAHAVVGQRHISGGAMQQAHMKLFFQRFDLQRDGYARDIKLCRSLGKAAVTHHAGEPDERGKQAGVQ